MPLLSVTDADAVTWTGTNVSEVMTWLGQMAQKHNKDLQEGSIVVEERQAIRLDLGMRPYIKATLVSIHGEIVVEPGKCIACSADGNLYLRNDYYTI